MQVVVHCSGDAGRAGSGVLAISVGGVNKGMSILIDALTPPV